MRIHDKFVIELAEVIKGYGNDYRVEEPFHLPCDYKFYEISGVAICEESVKRMIPLNVEIQKVLDKIRAEIEQLPTKTRINWDGCCPDIDCPKIEYIDVTKKYLLQIIDKYREGEKE